MVKLSFVKFQQKVIDDITSINLDVHKFTKVENRRLSFRTNGTLKYYDILSYASGPYNHEKKIMFNVAPRRKIHFIDKFIEPYIPLLAILNKPSNHDKILFTFALQDNFRRGTDTVLLQDDYNYEALKERLLYLISLSKNSLDAMSDIRVLDSLANETIANSKIGGATGSLGYYYHKMIIAKLAGNSTYEDIYRYYLGVMESDVEKQSEYMEESKIHITIAKQLYNDLKNVKPLENPILI